MSCLDERLHYIDCGNHCIHAGPIIIRGEDEYRDYAPDVRRRLLKHLMAFMRRSDLCGESVYIEKKHIEDEVKAAGKLAKLLSRFIKGRYIFLLRMML